MRPLSDEPVVRQWLAAEAGARPAEADRLFSALAAAHWSRLEAPAALAGRIAAALAAHARPAWWEFWWARVALLGGLVSVGGALAGLSPTDLAPAGVLVLVAGAQALGWILAASHFCLDAAWTAWAAATRVSSVIELVLSAPVSQLALALNLALAAAASVALRRLLRTEEIPS